MSVVRKNEIVESINSKGLNRGMGMSCVSMCEYVCVGGGGKRA